MNIQYHMSMITRELIIIQMDAGERVIWFDLGDNVKGKKKLLEYMV